MLHDTATALPSGGVWCGPGRGHRGKQRGQYAHPHHHPRKEHTTTDKAGTYSATMLVHQLPGVKGVRPQSAGPCRKEAALPKGVQSRHGSIDSHSLDMSHRGRPQTAGPFRKPVVNHHEEKENRLGPYSSYVDANTAAMVVSLTVLFARYVEELKLSTADVVAMGFDPQLRMPYHSAVHPSPTANEERPQGAFTPQYLVTQLSATVERLGRARQATVDILLLVSARDHAIEDLCAAERANDTQRITLRLTSLTRGDISAASLLRRIDDWRRVYPTTSTRPTFMYRGRDYETILQVQEKTVGRLANRSARPDSARRAEEKPEKKEPPPAPVVEEVAEEVEEECPPVGPGVRLRAALRIQSVYRMTLAQKRVSYMQLMVSATTRIQSVVRMQIAKSRVLWVRKLNIFAIHIQRMWRGWLARSKIHERDFLNESAAKIQCCYRGYVSRARLRAHILDHRRLQKAAVKISRFWGEYRARKQALQRAREIKAARIIGTVYKWHRLKNTRRSSHHGALLQSPESVAAADDPPAPPFASDIPWQAHRRSLTEMLDTTDPLDVDPEVISPGLVRRQSKRSKGSFTGAGETLFGLAARDVLKQPRRSRNDLFPEESSTAAGSARFSNVAFCSPNEAGTEPPVKVLYTAPFIDEVCKGDWLVLPPCPVDPSRKVAPTPERILPPFERCVNENRLPEQLTAAQRLGIARERDLLAPYANLIQSCARARVGVWVVDCVRRGLPTPLHHTARPCGRILSSSNILPHPFLQRPSDNDLMALHSVDSNANLDSNANQDSPPSSPIYRMVSSVNSPALIQIDEDTRIMTAVTMVAMHCRTTLAVHDAVDRRARRVRCLEDAVALRRRHSSQRLQRWWCGTVAPRLHSALQRGEGEHDPEDTANEVPTDISECRRQKHAVSCIERFWKRQRRIRAVHEGYIQRIIHDEARLNHVLKIQGWWKWMYAYKINNPYKQAAVRERIKRELQAKKLRRELEQESAVVIQTVWHMFRHRKRSTDVAAVTLPARLRSELRLASAVTIQRFYRLVTTKAQLKSALEVRRKNLVALTSQELFVEKITRIQALFRGHRARKVHKEGRTQLHLRRFRAAEKIQKVVRGYLVRRWYKSFHRMQEKALREHMAKLRKELQDGWPNDFPYPLS